MVSARTSQTPERSVGGYQERPSRFGRGAVLWTRTSEPTAGVGRVLPDGCMDLIWSEATGGLLVAGPDTRAHVDEEPPGAAWAGLRFAPGTAPSVLGVPAVELRDQRVPLTDLWSPARARRLADQVNAAADHGAALEEIALVAAVDSERPDPLCQMLLADVRRGLPVAELATRAAVSERQLHRRALVAFGYGPKTLARVLRMREALELAATGLPFVEVALATGYADQAHLAREVRALAGASLTELVGRPAPRLTEDRRTIGSSAQGSGANRSTEFPSGSRTTA